VSWSMLWKIQCYEDNYWIVYWQEHSVLRVRWNSLSLQVSPCNKPVGLVSSSWTVRLRVQLKSMIFLQFEIKDFCDLSSLLTHIFSIFSQHLTLDGCHLASRSALFTSSNRASCIQWVDSKTSLDALERTKNGGEPKELPRTRCHSVAWHVWTPRITSCNCKL
jgi:hypothetical protein